MPAKAIVMERDAPAKPHAPQEPSLARQTASDFSAEFHLAAACCRWPPCGARNAAVGSAAAAAGLDWAQFANLERRHRIAGLVHEALAAAAIVVPAVTAERLAAQARRIAKRNLLLAFETVRLQRAFDAARIPSIVLKGIALAQLVYGSLQTKHTRDIDFLVPPDCAEAAVQILEREGYALSPQTGRLSAAQRQSVFRHTREIELFHRDNALPLELQWRAAANPVLLRGVDACSGAQDVTISAGFRLRTLAQADLFAYLCVHGARHAWSRLKWLADINALLAGSDADTMRLYRHARHIGAGLCAGQALLLCHRLFDLALPAALAEDLCANKRIEKLVAVGLAAMRAPHAETAVDAGIAGVARSVRTQFLLGQGWAFHSAQCRVALAGATDVVRFPLPRPFYFLYPVLRLPLWLWRRARIAHKRRIDSRK
jgi:hypothetical protein